MKKTNNNANNTNNNENYEKLNQQTEYISTSKLEDGQSIEGTVVGFRPSVKFPDSTSIVMRLLNGEIKNVNPSGNLKYAVRDGLLKIGNTYKIQREGSRKVKGMTAGNFGIYQAKNTEANTNTEDTI